jgi:hypothetical protein
MPTIDLPKELQAFMMSWLDSAGKTKKAFERLLEHLAAKNSTEFSFHARPGVSYSLRTALSRQTLRPFFSIIDIIDDPDAHWLSVCFYNGTITDPDSKGILIPQGILGEDGYCFDLEEFDETLLGYLEKRMDEAYASALQTRDL